MRNAVYPPSPAEMKEPLTHRRWPGLSFGLDTKSRKWPISERRRDSSFCHSFRTLWGDERLPSSGHTCRAHNSGRGCHIVPFALERRSRLKGIGHAAVVFSSWNNSDTHGWFLQRKRNQLVPLFPDSPEYRVPGSRAAGGKSVLL